MRYLIRYDDWLIGVTRRVLEFLNDWLSLDRNTCGLIAIWAMLTCDLTEDCMRHHYFGIFWDFLTATVLAIALYASNDAVLRESAPRYLGLTFRISSQSLLTFMGIGDYVIPARNTELEWVRLFLTVSTVAATAALYIIAADFPPRKRGRKRKALLEKLKTWADVPVPSLQPSS